VQDAAYSTLLRNRRQQLHAQIASTLEGQFPEIVATRPALIAQHCAEAGLDAKAVDYWLKAGQQAVARSSVAEADAQFRWGLNQVRDYPMGLQDKSENSSYILRSPGLGRHKRLFGIRCKRNNRA
jgi:hypothetical protein